MRDGQFPTAAYDLFVRYGPAAGLFQQHGEARARWCTARGSSTGRGRSTRRGRRRRREAVSRPSTWTRAAPRRSARCAACGARCRARRSGRAPASSATSTPTAARTRLRGTPTRRRRKGVRPVQGGAAAARQVDARALRRRVGVQGADQHVRGPPQGRGGGRRGRRGRRRRRLPGRRRRTTLSTSPPTTMPAPAAAAAAAGDDVFGMDFDDGEWKPGPDDDENGAPQAAGPVHARVCRSDGGGRGVRRGRRGGRERVRERHRRRRRGPDEPPRRADRVQHGLLVQQRAPPLDGERQDAVPRVPPRPLPAEQGVRHV